MRLFFAAPLFLAAFSASASLTSYRNANPIGWMHLLPVGETPGWSTPYWIDLEINHSNTWNKEFEMTDTRTGEVYTYLADFEQSSAIANFGFGIDRIAVSAEFPYAYRNGGVLDEFVDQFHQRIGSNRFMRNHHRDFGNHFKIQKDGVDALASEHSEGLGSWKLKLKYWMWKWQGSTPGACECGAAFSFQAKFPIQKREKGLSSGANDYTGMFHLGVPINQYSGAWLSTAITKLGPNDSFDGWPRNTWLRMHELSLNIAFSKKWGILMQGRLESPLFMKEHLDYTYTMTDDEAKKSERIASGWNGMMYWRGSQSLGPRYTWGNKGDRVSFLILEDWGVGKHDGRGDWLYVNNAPDFAIVSQLHLNF
jgi:hypothetical protein